MICKFVRLHPAAKVPTKAHDTDMGFDLYAIESFLLDPGGDILVKTGIAIELPPGYGAVVRSRSSQAKRRIIVCGGNGTVDPGYRGDIGVGLMNLGNGGYDVKVGDRIAQLVIEQVHDVVMVEVDALTDSERGANGFGSSGR